MLYTGTRQASRWHMRTSIARWSSLCQVPESQDIHTLGGDPAGQPLTHADIQCLKQPGHYAVV